MNLTKTFDIGKTGITTLVEGTTYPFQEVAKLVNDIGAVMVPFEDTVTFKVSPAVAVQMNCFMEKHSSSDIYILGGIDVCDFTRPQMKVICNPFVQSIIQSFQMVMTIMMKELKKVNEKMNEILKRQEEQRAMAFRVDPIMVAVDKKGVVHIGPKW